MIFHQPDRVARSVARLTQVRYPVRSLSWKLIMKSFLRSSPPPSIDSRSELSVTGESIGTEYWLTGDLSLPRNNLVRLTDCSDMTIAVY